VLATAMNYGRLLLHGLLLITNLNKMAKKKKAKKTAKKKGSKKRR